MLGQFIPQFGISQALGGIAGLQHRYLGRNGVMPGILLILGGMHAWIIGHSTDHAAVDAYVRRGIQRISGHIEAHMLHGAKAPGAAGGRAKRYLKGNLLIGRPFRIDILAVLYHAFGNFGARRTGIGGNDRNPRLIQAPGNRLVAQQQFFHGIILSWEYQRSCGAAADLPFIDFSDPPLAGPCR